MKRARPTPAVRPLELPHERDESTDPPGAARKVIKQAAEDVNAGQVDTDNYTRASAVEATAPEAKAPVPRAPGRKQRGR